MKDDLDKLLKSARVPEHSPGYWEFFPKRVTSQMMNQPAIPRRGRLFWLIGASAAGVIIATGILIGPANKPPVAPQISYAQLYRQIAAMFPNQVQAIVVDERGVKLVLSETPNVPRSQPLLVNACNPDGCRQVITFSGQQVKINGDTWDVLLNGQNEVVVAGRLTDRYRIEAGAL